MLHYLIQLNYATMILILCLLIFIITNDYFDKKVRLLFLLSSNMLLGLVLVDSVEYWASQIPGRQVLRIWMSAIGYSLRPTIIFVVILLLLRGKIRKRMWLAAPLLFNALIAFSALFTDIAFSYSSDNEFVRGPLGYFAFVTSGFYAVVLLICTVGLYRSIHLSETLISITVVCMFVISTAMESVWKYDGTINATGAVSLVFYYLYLNTQQFKRDPMTNALNRRCFYLDAEKNITHLSAVMSIDLNNLKQLNDGFGHAKGDEAICALSRSIENVLPKNCFLYRTGGDEFMVLCFHKEKSTVKQLLLDMKTEFAKTSYSCAIGMAYNDNSESFDSLCSRADQEMYADKFRMKNKS